MKKSARIITHGCRLNQAESLLLRDLLARDGWQQANADSPVDLVVVNTCCVTGLAEAKCRQSIRQAVAHSPNAFVAVIGCLPQAQTEDFSQWEGVDLVLGNDCKLDLIAHLGQCAKNKTPLVVRQRIKRGAFEVPFDSEGAPYPQRANLKVQDGCDFACAYCIIPRSRGPARSRRFADAVAEARALAARGVRELVLTGVNIGMYSENGYFFLDLIDALAQIKEIRRLRISSIEPTTVPAEGLFARMKDPAHPLVPYLHLPIQAGSQRVLDKMRRRYQLTEALDFVRHAAENVPGIGLGTDILVGHPYETLEAFDEACQTFINSPFHYAHVFSYSERPGSLSSRMDEQVPVAERHRRSRILRALSAQKHREWARGRIGQTVEVLFENPRKGYWPAFTQDYLRVIVHDERFLRNQLAEVKLVGLCGDAVEGEVLRLLD